MRKINYGLMSMLTLLMCAITSCGDAERPSYDGPNYILFSDTLTVLAVQNNEEVFDIPVAATEACSYDRTVAVEVIDKKSNAIEGKHYTIESNTITIKAGERAANVRIRGNYDAIAATDSLGLTLRLRSKPLCQRFRSCRRKPSIYNSRTRSSSIISSQFCALTEILPLPP